MQLTSNLEANNLFNSSVGFDRILNNLFNGPQQLSRQASHRPDYNIEVIDENSYKITMSVPGVKRSDLNITATDNRLTVCATSEQNVAGTGGDAKIEDQSQNRHYLYKGFETSSFELSFNLADHLEVKSAELDNGLLTIHLQRNIPESAQPRHIDINVVK